MNNLKAFLLTLPGAVGQRLLRRANRTNGRSIPSALAGGSGYVQGPVRKDDLKSKVDPGVIAAITPLPPPKFGWQMLTKPVIQIVSPNTFYVEFSTPQYAKLNSGEAGNQILFNELDALTDQKRTIIFKLPDKVVISSNILNMLAAANTVLKMRGGKLMICASEQQTFLMLLNFNEGFSLHWDLDEALRELKDENMFQSMSQGRGYVKSFSKTP